MSIINVKAFWLAGSAVAANFFLSATACATLPEQVQQIKVGEAEAISSCDALIHFDTLNFEPCIKKLAKRSKATPFTQLGIFYSGYVSAMDYAHGGLPGARQTAWRLLNSASKLQNQLGVDSYTLCETLPGNCKIRVPASEQMLRSTPPKPARIPNNQHLHPH